MHKILVIADDESVRSTILKLLEAENLHVIEAENSQLGVQMAKEQIPDLILSDIIMSKMDGYGVRYALRQNSVTATIPFIFISDKAEKADIRLGMILGADDYLAKPFTGDELLEVVFAQLDKKAVFDRQFKENLDKLRFTISDSLPYELLVPLKQIKEFLQTLIKDHNSLERQTILEMSKEAYASSLRLQRLSHNFLFYALLEITIANPEQLKALQSSCISMAKNVITNVAVETAKCLEREADLHLDLQDAALLILEANLAKIVEEIIDNAFKFSTTGTPVSVKSIVDNNMFILYVTDQGEGLSSAQIANIGAYIQFERKRNQEGSGLGLAIAKRLCELYTGELTVNRIHRQTTVRVALPMQIE